MSVKSKWFWYSYGYGCIPVIILAIVYVLGSMLDEGSIQTVSPQDSLLREDTNNEEDIDVPTFGMTINGKPGINLTGEGVGIHMDMDGEIGIGFGF